jgi:hypothetical protein
MTEVQCRPYCVFSFLSGGNKWSNEPVIVKESKGNESYLYSELQKQCLWGYKSMFANKAEKTSKEQMPKSHGVAQPRI